MTRIVVAVSDLEDVIPEMLTLSLSPTVIALKNGNDELHRPVDNFCERSVDGIHCVAVSRRIG